MRVYVLLREGSSDVVGVFSTEEKAEDARKYLGNHSPGLTIDWCDLDVFHDWDFKAEVATRVDFSDPVATTVTYRGPKDQWLPYPEG